MNKLVIVPRALSLVIALVFLFSGVYSVVTYQPPKPAAKPIAVVRAAKPTPPAVAPSTTPPEQQTIAASYPPPVITEPVVQTPTLMQYAQELGINVPPGLTLTLTDSVPGGDDAAAGYSAVASYYPLVNTIYVGTGYTPYQTRGLLAYEYMHYIWYAVANWSQRDQLAIEGANLLATNAIMQQQFGTLAPINASEAADEQISTACTRIPMDQLSDYVNAYCNQYIPNRGLIL